MQYGSFSAVYDRLMKDVDYDGWAGYVSGFIPRGAEVLECACGTGEISIRLAKLGYSVTATDISEDMLRVAAEKQRSRGLAARALRFVKMDMRSLGTHKPVDCVVSCCDGVNYLTSRGDVKRFFASAWSALKPGGQLLFDISSRYKLSEVLGNNCFVDNGEDVAYLWQNCYDGETKLIRMDLSFFVKQAGGYARIDETHIQRAHSLREIGSWLNEAGFEYEAYGFLTTEKPGEKDERIQFAAKKTDGRQP